MLGSLSNAEFNASALRLCREAYQLIDFVNHKGSHPALGAVDHVCFSPLVSNDETLNTVGDVANKFATSLADNEKIPVFTYGHANSILLPKLRDIRRSLGYFEPVESDTLGPSIVKIMRQCLSQVTPTYGTDYINDRSLDSKGTMCVGCVPMILNYNMRFRQCDSKNLVMQVTRYVREVGLGVEALTLQHSEGSYEVACNLTQTEKCGPDQVLASAMEKAATLGIEVESSYTTGPTIEQLQQIYIDTVRE